MLQAIVLLPAFGLPYAVAVRHVFSPRTVLRRSLQYAFARRTLTALVVLPVVALVASLVQQRDQSLAMIVSGRPLFYLFFLAMLGLGLQYRDAAQRWLDQRFFRAEYDAREILVSLAGRVPYEADPRDLVAMVVTQIDSALHPENIAVLASDSPTRPATRPAAFAPVSALRVEATPLPADSGVVTLLRWSDKPLEVFLDDEQSPVARVPPADRAWLAAMQRGAAGADLRRRQRPAAVRRVDRARARSDRKSPTRPRIASCCAASRCRWAWRSTCRGCASRSAPRVRVAGASARRRRRRSRRR